MMKTKTIAHNALAAMLCAAMVSCDTESDAEARMPVMDRVTFDKTEVHAGDTIKATLYLKDSGEYVRATYNFTGSPAGVISAKEFTCASPQDKVTFDIVIKKDANDIPELRDDESTDVTVTVAPMRVTSFVGDQLYLDPAPMGKLTQTFTLVK